MKKTLILDLGNVLVYVDFRKFYDRFKSVLSFSYEETMKKLSPLMAEFNKGVILPENFYKQCCRVLKLNVDFAFFSKVWIDIFAANNELINFVSNLKKDDIQIILASNTDILHYDSIKKKTNLRFLDGEFLSYKEGVIKPDNSYFKKIIDKYALNPADCIFFDDLQENITSAEECGIKAVLHLDNKSTMTQINEFIG